MLFSSTAYARVCNVGEATLSWDANTEADLAGYRVYQSEIPGIYINPHIIELTVPIVGRPKFHVEALTEKTTYFWVVTAFDLGMNESGFSNEVTKTIPDLPPCPPVVTLDIIFPIVP